MIPQVPSGRDPPLLPYSHETTGREQKIGRWMFVGTAEWALSPSLGAPPKRTAPLGKGGAGGGDSPPQAPSCKGPSGRSSADSGWL